MLVNYRSIEGNVIKSEIILDSFIELLVVFRKPRIVSGMFLVNLF